MVYSHWIKGDHFFKNFEQKRDWPTLSNDTIITRFRTPTPATYIEVNVEAVNLRRFIWFSVVCFNILMEFFLLLQNSEALVVSPNLQAVNNEITLSSEARNVRYVNYVVSVYVKNSASIPTSLSLLSLFIAFMVFAINRKN